LVRHEHSMYVPIQTKKEQILMNEQQSRSFWCWTVVLPTTTTTTTQSVLVRLVQYVDTVLTMYQQPIYYQPPQFHITVASFPGELNNLHHVEEETDDDDDDDHNHDDGDDDDDTMVVLCVNKLICTFGGTKEFTIPLKGGHP
jgi:hypothetical protein